MNNRIYFVAELQQMAESEVLSMIPNDTLMRIRQSDPHPMFKVFSIGHEGDAKGANVIGMGSKLVRWARDVVVQMFNKIQQGLQVFKGHNPNSNSHSGRQSVGEIVGKTMKEINGALHTLGAVYIKPEFRNEKLDVASLEGVVEMGERMDGDVDVLNVKSITGLAVDDSNVSQPAMAGATLQASLQMFTRNNEREFQQMEITKDQVKEAVLKLRLNPTDIFSEDDIVASEPAKKAKQTEYEHAKRLEKRLGEAREENSKLQGEVTKYEGEISKLKEKASVGTAKETFASIATERKLDPKFQKFVERNLKDFKSDKDGEEFKSELGKFVDGQVQAYKDNAALYDIKDVKITTEDKPDDKTKSKSSTDAPSSDDNNDQNQDQQVSDEYTDPAKNDFIPA